MVLTRSTALLKSFKFLKSNKVLINTTRNSGGGRWNYRTGNTEQTRYSIVSAETLGAFFWWWVLWHLWTEPGHILGEFEYPDASKWTDEELGIPPEE